MVPLSPWQVVFLKLLDEKRRMRLVWGRKGPVWIPDDREDKCE